MAAGLVACARCGVPAAASARFCGACGFPVPRQAVGEVRKTVTALFCDVSGSTALGEQLDPEALRAVMERHFTAVAAVLARHGGTVEKFAGDAVMAVFGVPVAHEDDALRACRSAIEIFAAARDVDEVVRRRHGASFAVRIGIESGEVLVGDLSRASTFASGPAVNVAARLEQVAAPGECLLGPNCHRLVRELVEVEPRNGLVLKGVAGAVDAVRLVAAPDLSQPRRLTTGRIIGREDQLALLRQVFERAAATRTCQLVTVLGAAGVGKTRLADELADRLGAARLLRGRCLSYGEGVTWWPLVEIVRQAAGLTGAEPDDEAHARLLALVGAAPEAAELVARIAPVAGLAGTPGRPEDTSWAVRRLVEELARSGPLVLLVDDLHWADAGLLEVLEDVTEWLRGVPVLILLFARPEFVEDHPTWAIARANAVTCTLDPLADDDIEALATQLAGRTLDRDTLRQVLRLAGGNPLFVEHLLAVMTEPEAQKAGRGAGDAAVAGWATLRTPPTITALLTARLDRLPNDERTLLGVASVMGEQFYRSALRELAFAAGQLRLLSALIRKGLVRPAISDLPGQDALAFSHVLVREAAYAGVPKMVRADLHERCARWMEKATEGRDLDVLVGAHLESAYLCRAELGTVDEDTRRLGLEAARRLEAAGRALLVVDDVTAAVLLERADRLRDDSTPERWELRLELARLLLEQRREEPTRTLLREVGAVAAAAGHKSVALRAELLLARQRQQRAPAGATEPMRILAEQALNHFLEASDPLGQLAAYDALIAVANAHGDVRGVLAHSTSAARAAAAAGRPLDAEDILAGQVLWRIVGDTPASEGLTQSRELLAGAEHRAIRLPALIGVAHFSGLLGERSTAAEAWLTVDALIEEMRPALGSFGAFVHGQFDLATCAWEAAVEHLTESSRTIESLGDLGVASTELASLAVALLHAGRPDEARQTLERAERIRASEDRVTAALCLLASGWLAALDGNAVEARAQLRRAFATLPADMLTEATVARLGAAEAEAALGDAVAARAHRQVALDLCRRKENQAAAAHVERLLGGAGRV